MATLTSEFLGRRNQVGSGEVSFPRFRWLFVALTLLAVMPFWTVRYPVIADYPNHLARWFVLYHEQDPVYRFSTMYAPAWGPLPYITPDILAVALQYVLPIDIVGRCILSLCVISVAFGGLFFIKTACPQNFTLALFGLLVAFNPNLLMGSISNELSLGLCLLVVSCWVLYCSSRRASMALCVLFGLMLVYFSHLIGFFVAGIAMGVYALFQETRWKTLGVLAALSAPTLAVSGYNLRHGGPAAGFVYAGMTVWDKLRNLLFPVRLFTFKTLDALLLASLAILILFLIRAQRRIVIQPAWFAVCVVLLLSYLIAPGEYGNGGYADVRIMPFLYFFLIPVFQFSRIPRFLVIALASIVLFRVVTVEGIFAVKQPGLQQLTAAFDAIPRDARVLPLAIWQRDGGLVGQGDVHHLDYGVIRRGFLVPTLFHLPGVQPLRLTDNTYCLNVFCHVTNASDEEWRTIARSYDYLWLQKKPAILPFPSGMAGLVFSNESVAVYRFIQPALEKR